MTGHQIRCTGRVVDLAGQPVGDECGRTHPRRSGATDVEHLESARAAGWRISPARPDGDRNVTCDRCSRPDPTLVALCRDLIRSTQ